MPSSARLGVIFVSFVVCGTIFGAASASAQSAPADRCTGTFCDFYYGNASPATASPAQPAAPSQLSVPGASLFNRLLSSSEPAPAATAPNPPPAVAAAPAKRCTGTLCDAFYGGSASDPDDTSRAEPLNGQAMAGPSLEAPPLATRPLFGGPPAGAPATAAAEPAADAEPETPQPAYVEPPREKPVCVGTTADPWRCFR